MAWDAEEREHDRHEAALQREDAARTRDDVRQSRLNAQQLSAEDAARRERMRALLRRAEAQRERLTAGSDAPGAVGSARPAAAATATTVRHNHPLHCNAP